MSYPYSLTPGHVTLQSTYSESGANSLTERRVTETLRQKELLQNQKVYSLKLDRNRQAGYDRLIFGPNALTSLYPRPSKKAFASTDAEREMTLRPYSSGQSENTLG